MSKLKELFDDASLLNALSEEEFYAYIGDNIHKVTENPRDWTRIINFYNRIDELLEKNVNEYSDLVSNTPAVLTACKVQIEEYHKKLNKMFTALGRVLNTKVNIAKFQSAEHLIKLIPVCLDYPIIRKCLHILFSKFNEEELPHEECVRFEQTLPRLVRNVDQLFQNYNLASFYSKRLMELFQDDPRYNTFLERTQSSDKDSQKIIPEYTNELNFEIYRDDQSSYQNKIVSFRISNLKEKYAEESHIYACRKINEEYGLNLKEDSAQWDSLAFKIRACMNGASLQYRAHVVSVAMDALKLLVCFRKQLHNQKELNKHIHNLPPVFDFTSFILSSFNLFHLQVIPDLHESIVTCVSSILTMVDPELDEFRDFKDFSQQIVAQYQFFHKILKDCTTLQLSHVDGKPKIITTPSLLPQETATSQDFLGCFLYLLHIEISHSFIDSESNFPTNQIYSITGIISSLVNVLKPPVDGYFLYSIESLNIAIDTFWMILPNQTFINDLNLMDRLIERAHVDLELLLQTDKQYYHLSEGEWKPIKKEEHYEVVQGLLKLLDSPFEHQVSTRIQMAPTIARKIGEGTLIDVFRRVIEADVVNDAIFMTILLLISDIAREVPNSIDSFIERGIVKAILERLKKPFGRDLPHVHLIVYFVNMLGFNKKGFELEREYKILEKLFNIFTDWNNAGSPTFNELINDIGKEISELAKSLEVYRELIADLIINCMKRITNMEETFLALCLKKLRGELKGKITFESEKSSQLEKMEEEQQKKDETVNIVSTNTDLSKNDEKEKDFVMSKEELQEFERDLGRISILIQNNCNIFSRIIISEFKMREVMHQKNAFEYMFKILSFPLLSLVAVSPINWASPYFKHMANKISGTDHDVQHQIYNILMTELDGLEKLVGNLSHTQDFIKVLNDDICYDARINGLYFILNKYKERSINTIYVMGTLSYSEVLIDFLRCHDTVRLSSEELFKLVDRLADLYVLLINQIKREDANFVRRNLESIKVEREVMSEEKVKEIVDRCKTAISDSHASNRFTYHQTLRKFFKKVLGSDYDYESAEKYANIILKIINQLNLAELKLGEEKDIDATLQTLNENNAVLSFLHEFHSNTSYKRFRSHPEFFFTYYKGNGFHTILDALNQLKTFTETHHNVFQEENSVTTLDNIKFTLLKEGLSMNYLKLSQIMKMVMLVPIQPNLEARINGLLQRGADGKLDYFFGACKDLIEKFYGVVTGLGKTFEAFYLYHIKRTISKQKEKISQNDKQEEKEVPAGINPFYENIGALLDVLFECVKRIQDLSRDIYVEEGNPFEDRNPREGYLTQIVLQSLTDMGFPRERAELAVRNVSIFN